jgi:hypothetical protein
VCFDAAFMFCHRSLSHFGRRVSFRYAHLAVVCLWIARPVHAEPSLAQLLVERPAANDPSVALAEQLADIERRPFAAEVATQRALQRVHAELAVLRAARGRGASAAVLRRQTALVWAALSWADRLEARARTAARLKQLALRADEAEAALARAQQAQEPAAATRVVAPHVEGEREREREDKEAAP